jgi:hypothetical protein
MPLRRLSHVTRACRIRVLFTVAVISLGMVPGSAQSQERGVAPDSLTSGEFWAFFTSMSEPDGYFLSENFVSNEVSFQEVIPTLQKTLTKDGVYLGVGPEQNFTYISNLGPRMAVIFDIRRQNAMQHLLYKALFELSSTRAEFVSRLFSRPAVARLAAGIDVNALFDSAAAAPASDSAYNANFAAIIDVLTKQHAFALTDADIQSIAHVYKVFFKAGTDVNYGYRSGSQYVRTTYPTYGMLQTATNADSVQMAFLANEDRYNAVRSLQLKNLIVPVVGDFGGPAAIKSVAKWLRARSLMVTAFYVSNVEQYLWRESGSAERFYANVSSLPIDTTSRFIRSVPRSPTMMPTRMFTTTTIGNAPTIGFSITTDAKGNVVTQTFRDSAGIMLVQTTVDSSGSRKNQASRDSAGIARAVESFRTFRDSTSVSPDSSLRRMMARRDSIIAATSQWQVASGPTMQVVMGGSLTSGLASMDKTLKSFFLGELKNYGSVVEMTKVTGWR